MALTDFGPQWGNRIAADVDGESLRFRIAASQLRASRSEIEGLCRSVDAALRAEKAALDRLHGAAERQHRSMLRAVHFGRYLDILASHLAVATNGQVGAAAVASDDADLLGTLEQVGAELRSMMPFVGHARAKS